MAEKDHREKIFEEFNDVFSDLINTLLFHGKQVIKEDDLESAMARSSYKVEGTFEEQERDVKKFWKNRSIRIAVLGSENQTAEDPECIFRNFGYDGSDYRDQVRRRNEVRRENARRKRDAAPGTVTELLPVPDFYPVITVTLYFGEKRWKSSLSLKDHVKIPDGLDEYVSDYKINLFEIAYLTDEQVSMFKSDFRYVAEYFVESRKQREGKQPNFKYSLEQIKHVEEFVELMNAVTNSKQFSDLPMILNERGGETMWTYLFDNAREQGEKLGREQGEKLGREQGENKLGILINKLFGLGRMEDIQRASTDPEYRNKLYQEFQIA